VEICPWTASTNAEFERMPFSKACLSAALADPVAILLQRRPFRNSRFVSGFAENEGNWTLKYFVWI
jgi:hypothetical protein